MVLLVLSDGIVKNPGQMADRGVGESISRQYSAA